MAIGTNCHNYCNSKSERWLAVEIAIASQTETAFAEQPGEGACVFVLGPDFICVFYPSSFLRILKNNFFPPGTLEEIKRLVLRVARSPLINVPITSPPSASTALRSFYFYLCWWTWSHLIHILNSACNKFNSLHKCGWWCHARKKKHLLIPDTQINMMESDLTIKNSIQNHYVLLWNVMCVRRGL